MALHGLKSKIAVNMVILLAAGMGLTAFVALNLTQKIIVESEISKAGLFVTAMEETMARSFYASGSGLPGALSYAAKRLMTTSGAIFSTFVVEGRELEIDVGTFEGSAAAREYAREASRTGQASVRYEGAAMGLFWKQGAYLVVSSPVRVSSPARVSSPLRASAPLWSDDGRAGGLSVVLPLETVYGKFRNVQRLLFVYIFINAVILTVAGLYAISTAVVKPIHRLLKKAEEFQDSSDMVYFHEQSGNEFNRLSHALNTMFGRIADDREKLRRSVSSLEQANDELKKAQIDIIRAEKLASVGRLSSGIAHEIGNPLGIVSGYLELLGDEGITGPERADFLSRSVGEIKRIDGIIHQLLDCSRVQPRKQEPVSVHETIGAVNELLAVQPVMTGIDLSLGLSAENDMVFGDRDQLLQVFLNLLLNAADAVAHCSADRCGRVVIRTQCVACNCASNHSESGKNTLEVVFRDNGCGIAPNDLENIFDPFFTTKEPGKGTGLGLSVCFMIIKSLNGTIRAESTEGEGTSMIIDLPISK